MAELKKCLELRARIIQSGEEFSFQLYNAINNTVLFTAPAWWNSKEDCEATLRNLRTRFISDALNGGYDCRRPTDPAHKDWIDLYEDPDNPIDMLRALLGAQEDRQASVKVIDPDSDEIPYGLGKGPLKIMGVLAVHRESKKYGFCVMTSEGETLMRPQEWFDTAKDAYNASKTNPRVREVIEHELRKRGLQADSYFDGMEGIGEVPDGEFDDVMQKLENDIKDKIDKRTSTAGIRSLGGFTPNV